MTPLDALFFVSLALAAMAAGWGGRAAMALVTSNVLLGAYAILYGFSLPLWLAADILVILVIVVPGLRRWGGVTQRNMILCALFVISWRFYLVDLTNPVQFHQMTVATTWVATIQLLLSLPWGRAFHWLRFKLKGVPMPPDSHFDERRIHAGWQ